MLNTQKENCGSAYVINLDRSTARWKKVSKVLDQTGIKYQRFSAIDGYKIEFADTTTGNKFTGQDLKNHKEIMKSNIKYQLTCNPDDVSPTQFDYQGRKLTAGEYGVWCSNMVIWEKAIKNNCNHTVIFEDDITIKTQDLNKKLDYLIKALPKTYDVAYLDLVIWGKKLLNSKSNPGIIELGKGNDWYGQQGYVLSIQAVEKLTKTAVFSEAIDLFFAAIIKNEMPEIDYNFEGYLSAEKLVGIARGMASEIHEMGRDH